MDLKQMSQAEEENFVRVTTKTQTVPFILLFLLAMIAFSGNAFLNVCAGFILFTVGGLYVWGYALAGYVLTPKEEKSSGPKRKRS